MTGESPVWGDYEVDHSGNCGLDPYWPDCGFGSYRRRHHLVLHGTGSRFRTRSGKLLCCCRGRVPGFAPELYEQHRLYCPCGSLHRQTKRPLSGVVTASQTAGNVWPLAPCPGSGGCPCCPGCFSQALDLEFSWAKISTARESQRNSAGPGGRTLRRNVERSGPGEGAGRRPIWVRIRQGHSGFVRNALPSYGRRGSIWDLQ